MTVVKKVEALREQGLHTDNPGMADARSEYSRVNLSSDPIYRYLRITKGGPGGAAGHASEQDLVDAAWLQRLRRIHQLQSAWWVFATAEHSRFQHALGAMHLAGEWAKHLYPSLKTSCSETPSTAVVEETMRMAGLLHDVGHGPFGHFFDENYLDTWRIDHEVIGRALIMGPLAELVRALGASPTADFAAGERIDPRWVAYLVSSAELEGFRPPAWLSVLRPAMVGAFSADNMDYVPRDSYICGVSTGPVDVQRIIHYSFISERGLTLHAHAAEALYMFLNARLYLYHQVYFHRTVRRIDLQLREVFRPTLDQLLGGNPLKLLDRYQALTEWSLLSDVDRWARGDGDAHQRELARPSRRLRGDPRLRGHDGDFSRSELSERAARVYTKFWIITVSGATSRRSTVESRSLSPKASFRFSSFEFRVSGFDF